MAEFDAKKFIGDWGAGLVAMIGIFLIYMNTIFIGVIIYGILAHLTLATLLNVIFDEASLEKFKDRLKGIRRKSFLKRLQGRIILISFYGVSLYVLAIKGRWYLFALTIVLGCLQVILSRMCLDKGSKAALEKVQA